MLKLQNGLGKYIVGYTIEAVSMEESKYLPATIQHILGGTNFKIGVEYHIINALAV